MNKKVLLGCGLAVLVVLLALVAVMVMVGSKVANFASEVVTQGQERSAWLAPAQGSAGEALFPEKLDDLNRQSMEKISGLPMLNIQRAGERGSYRQMDGRSVEIYTWEIRPDEVQPIFDQVGSAIDDGPYTTRMKFTFNGNAMRFSFSPPSTSGRFWFNKGWLFLFLTGDDVDLEPVEERYVKSVEGAGMLHNDLPLLPEADHGDDQ